MSPHFDFSDTIKFRVALAEQLTRIETRQDQYVRTQGDHERRLRSTERAHWKQMGIVTVLVFLLETFKDKLLH